MKWQETETHCIRCRLQVQAMYGEMLEVPCELSIKRTWEDNYPDGIFTECSVRVFEEVTCTPIDTLPEALLEELKVQIEQALIHPVNAMINSLSGGGSLKKTYPRKE